MEATLAGSLRQVRSPVHSQQVDEPFGWDSPVRVVTLGQPTDWRLKTLNQSNQQTLSNILLSYGVTSLFAPDPSTFNAVICDPEDLEETTHLPRQILLHQGCQADGMVLRAGEALAINSGDCPLVVVWYQPPKPKKHNGGQMPKAEKPNPVGQVAACHAGLNCLVDRESINLDRTTQRISVVHQAISCLPADPTRIHLAIHLAIGPKHFSHPLKHRKWGQANRRLIKYLARHYPGCLVGPENQGQIDLVRLITLQALRCHIPLEHIHWDRRDTYGDLKADGTPAWHSNRRQTHQKQESRSRNLVIAIHAK